MIKWYKKLSKDGQIGVEAIIATLSFIGVGMIIPFVPVLGIALTILWVLFFMLFYKGIKKTNVYDADKGNYVWGTQKKRF
jgi:predicted membrane protein